MLYFGVSVLVFTSSDRLVCRYVFSFTYTFHVGVRVDKLDIQDSVKCMLT